MIFDFQSPRALPAETYDFCICGTGPAGITLALKLADHGHKVALLEAGGKEHSAQSQEVYNAKSVGLQGWFDFSRLRFLGGTSNHWLGRCRPLDKSDFEYTSSKNIPGWPIVIDEISPYLTEAMQILDLDPDKGFTSTHPPLPDGKFDADAAVFSRPPTRFKKKYETKLVDHENIHLYINSNLVEVKLDADLQSVSGFVIRNYDGKEAQITATNYTLSMGAIENARILLNSDSQIKSGLGNQGDYVGRCFMEHPNITIGEFISNDATHQAIGADFEFYTSDALVQSQQTGKANLTFEVIKTNASHGRTRVIKDFFKTLSCDLGIEDKVSFISRFKCPGTGRIWSLFEQLPTLDSRVYLGEEIDSLGLRQAIVDWKMSAQDYQNVRTISKQIAMSFSDSGLGKVKLEDYILNEEMEIPITQHAHHMGTTRMATVAKDGVVDENCRVFGTNNLYVAGSSVFSTGGGCNPTLSIVQFTLRLANHLNGLATKQV